MAEDFLVEQERRRKRNLRDQIYDVTGWSLPLMFNVESNACDGVDSSWSTDGPSFGSPRTVTMNTPKVALAWDSPTNALSAGNTRFVIEQQLHYPVTALRLNILASQDLSEYDVIILPEGNYNSALGKRGADNLKKWVRGGGVLIALGNANRFTSDADFGLLDIKREYAFRGPQSKSGGSSDSKSSDKSKSQVFTQKTI